ncbi:alpha-xylosidase [Demequina mangrovi]|uniref:alpha-D-xyloside xylohydrolase n=1 Tax=Demequina mangrovi TaxID=1043493 RepID=A0A1H6W252_9MICO|nr:alpha-xylosidase [Demequina mangrovi]SEJ11018.1 alpha-D-xyloside xylohydrolase [Demequina mangrovi]
MKFTEGYWRVRDGFTALHPREIHEARVREDGRSLVVHAPSMRVEHRGLTLSNPEFTFTVRAPMDDVIAVTVEHFTGARRRGPDFEVSEPGATRVSVDAAGDAPLLRSGGLEMVFDRASAEFAFRTADGRELTRSGFKAVGRLTGPDGAAYMHQQLSLGIGETVYGLGERFGPVAKNGQAVDMWNDDSGTSSDRSYKNVPFWWTNEGYGVFVAHPEDVSFEVGSEKVGRMQFSTRGERLTYYVILGPTPKEVLTRYTALTGRPPRVPAWSYGLWLTTSFLTDYDEETVAGFIDGMAERDIPLSVFHYDCFWMREFQWCDFEWDTRHFPHPEARLSDHHADGVKVCVWINPYIGARSPLFAEGMENGYLLRLPDGGVYQTDFWQSGMGLVDFTNPEARAWYTAYLERLLDQGVDCFKTDFGESVPTDVVYHDGSDPMRMHNYYTYLYNRTVFELLERKRGHGEAVLFARSATAGGQSFPAHWGGDCESTYDAMAETLRGGLSLASSGFGYWAHDIGGFEGTPDPDLYKRWVAFGLLSSHSRLHGSSSVRVPWAFDEEAVEVLRDFTRLKLSLLPTLATVAEDTVARGVPMMRHPVLEFPDDPGVLHLDRQYMLGPDLMIAPVLRADGRVDYYLPEGRWRNLLTGDEVDGGRWVREHHTPRTLPLMVREGAVLALQDGRTDTEGSLLEGLRLLVHPTAEPCTRTVTLRSGFGEDAQEVDVTVEIGPDEVRATATDLPAGWVLEVAGVRADAVDGCAAVNLAGRGR